jgi:hypothetical protein
LRHEHALPLLRQVRQEDRLRLAGDLLEHERADGNLDLHVTAGGAGPVGPLAVLAPSGFELGMEAEIDERVLAGGGNDDDGAAGAAVAAVRPAARDERLAPEAQAAAAAVTGQDVDVDFVDEHARSGLQVRTT